MRVKEKNGIPCVCLPLRDPSKRMIHGFFTRRGGVSPAPYATLNVGPLSADAPHHVRENLGRILSTLSIAGREMMAARQVHGDCVIHVTPETLSRSVFSHGNPVRADGLTTDREGILLGILTADCLPVLLFDPGRRAIGAAHAGWRGTYKEIAIRTLRQMVQRYGTRPEDVWAALGPAIGPCCYDVGEEVAQLFLQAYGAHDPCIRTGARGGWTLDLRNINRRQLLETGVREARILSAEICTRCRGELFFSVRAQGEPTGRQISVIGLVPRTHQEA